jgi:8-oxo-dGTP pyrophosphatase MutT (NUDIX family)
MKTMEGVLVFFIRSDGKVLLAQKSSKAKVAWNKWNGYGGGIEKGETPKFAAVREVDEETDHGLLLLETNLEPRGHVFFFNPSGNLDWRVHVFVCRKFLGEPKATEEMRSPTWFNPKEIDALDMMPADKLFVPAVLNGKRIVNGWARFKQEYSGVRESYFEFENV